MTHSVEQKQAPDTGEGPYRCRIARSRADREAAFRLLYQSYLRSGLGEPNSYEMRVTPHHLLPDTQIFIASAYGPCTHGDVVSTVSLIVDSPLGLPLESMYSEAVAERRKVGLRIAEVSCLADRRHDLHRFFGVFCELNRLMIQYARHCGLDQVLIAVHPRHARFYQRNLGFKPMAGLARCPHVCNRPAVALCFDFAQVDQNPFRFYDRFFRDPLPPGELIPQSMPAEDVLYFRGMVDPTFGSRRLTFMHTAGLLNSAQAEDARECATDGPTEKGFDRGSFHLAAASD